MYLWKCWRDTLITFFILLGVLLAVGAYGAYVKFDPVGWIAAKPPESRFVWQGLATVLLDTTVGLVPVAGFFLGALGVGLEFEKGTADFLLTRPRTRGSGDWPSALSWSASKRQRDTDYAATRVGSTMVVRTFCDFVCISGTAGK